MVGIPSIPEWLEALLGEKFFNPCLVHESAKKNEKNIFCLDCCVSICPHCLSPHRSHRLLQIRRYVYHDVIRVDDVERLIDCSFVQSYTTNSAKVVFLNQRPQSRPFRGSGNICTTCDRSLQDPYLFCSLSCKINHLVRIEGGLNNKKKFQFFQPKEDTVGSYNCDFDDGQMTPDSILESRTSLHTSSGSTASTGTGAGGGCGGGDGVGGAIMISNCKATLACTATTEFVKKKRSSVSAASRAQQEYRPTCSLSSDISNSLNNRRKSSTPHRAPLY